MAPEVGTEEPYNELCDVYSFGILVWEMMSLAKPFDKIDMVSLIKDVWRPDDEAKRPTPSLMKKGNFVLGRGVKGMLNRRKELTMLLKHSQVKMGTPLSLQCLLERCWSYDLEKRPSMGQVEDQLREEIMAFRSMFTEMDDSCLTHNRRRSTYVYEGEEGEDERESMKIHQYNPLHLFKGPVRANTSEISSTVESVDAAPAAAAAASPVTA
jgi:serine/threonine protein kinase